MGTCGQKRHARTALPARVQFLPSGGFSVAAMVVALVGAALVLRRDVPKAYGLGVVMVAVFLVDFAGQVFTRQAAGLELGYQPTAFFRGEGWWMPFTSVFAHAPPSGRGILNLHLIGNLFILVTAGPALEARIGDKRFLLIFGLSALAALVAHTLLAYATDIVSPNQVAMGASGGIFGMLTAFAVRHPKERLPVILFFVFWLPAFVVLLIYLGINVFLMLGGSQSVAWWGHFAGFLTGLAFAYTVPAGPPTASLLGSARGLPDPARLEPLATTPHLRRILDRIKQFTPETRTEHDAVWADAWLDKFFAQATCPEGHAFKRDGLKATCAGGEATVDFARAR